MQSGVTRYRAYLLRIWQPAHEPLVRAVLRDVTTGGTHAFVDLAEMTRWLEQAVLGDPSPIAAHDDTRSRFPASHEPKPAP